jgi:hypothetical protein
MKLRNLCLAIVASVAVAACSTPAHRGADSGMRIQGHPTMLGTWAYPPSDYPGMCISFLSGGELRFRGGFLDFNPGRWEQDSRKGVIRIRLGGTSAFPADVLKYQMKHRPGTLLAFEERQRSLEYRISGDTRSVDFMNFVFYRDARCDAD